MSESDSDLEFESADEDLKGEDIDTSDLDIDDDEDDTNSTGNKSDPVSKNTLAADVKEISNQNKDNNKQQDDPGLPEKAETMHKEMKPVEPVDQNKFEEKTEPLEEAKSNLFIKLEKPSFSQIEKTVTSGWDADVDFSDIEDEPEQKQILEVKSAPKSGWDAGDDFSDIEDEVIEQKPKAKTSKPDEIKNLALFKDESFTQQPEVTESSWSGGWSGFGSIISKATSITTQLNSGINSVLESVEATIGAPDPTQLAKMSLEEEDELKKSLNEKNKERPTDTNDWINEDEGQEWFSIGNSIVSGGLGVLETVGKKTFQVMSDKDKNLKNTREFLKNVPTAITTQKPNLSQLLREAKETKEDLSNTKSLGKQEAFTFALFFEEFQGSIHLEALEMLSRQSNVKLEVLAKPKNLQPTLTKLEEFFDSEGLNDEEGEDLDDTDSFFANETFLNDFKLLVKKKMFHPEQFEKLINKYSKKCSFFMDLEKIIGAFKSTAVAAREIDTPVELLNESIKCFAMIASRVIELYHKASENILTEQPNQKRSKNSIENAESIYQITKLCLRSVTILADDFCRKCRTSAKESVSSDTEKSSNQVIAEIYLEASNGSTYTADAYLLLLPIFKTKVLE